MNRKAFAVVAPLALALAVASCGGGGDNGNSSGNSADVTAFCNKAREFQQLQSNFGNLSSVSEARNAFQQAAQKMQEVDAAAPPDLKSSADRVLAIFKDVSSAVQGASTPQDLQRKVRGVASELNQLSSPLNDLKSFYQDNCKQ